MDLNTTAHCVATTAPDEPRARLSLTLHALASSRWIAVHLHGQEKWQTLQHATADGDARRYPILAVLEQKQVPIHVYWSA
jgi:6-phosphogluconolactonase